MSYWTFTDIFEEAGPRATPFHGGFGLINYEDIAKPAFYAYRFLNELGPAELVNRDAASLVTRDPRGGVQALLWDLHRHAAGHRERPGVLQGGPPRPAQGRGRAPHRPPPGRALHRPLHPSRLSLQ